MTVLIILGLLLLIIVGIMLVRVQVIIEADTSARVFLKILFIKIQLFPKEQKQPNLKHYSPKQIAKREAKKKRKADAKQRKKAKKEQKKQQEKANAPAEKKKKKKMTIADITELISLVISLAKTFFLRFGKRLRLDLTRIHITVASDDAAKTALQYGAVSAGVACLCEILDSNLNVRPNGVKDITVNADFLHDEPSIDIVASASLRVWHAFDILFALALDFVKKKLLKM